MSKESDITLNYYKENANNFVSDTLSTNMHTLQGDFISMLAQKGRVLDLGCGSGRDSKYFIDKGFLVTSVDGSQELCKIAENVINQKVICSRFEDFNTSEKYIGVWACASLLHLNKADIKSVITKISKFIVKDGVFYMSFKYGDFEGFRNGRYFTDLTEFSFSEIIKNIPNILIEKEYITGDARVGRENEKWLNVFCKII